MRYLFPKDPMWLTTAKVGDKVYLVKEDRYCHIEKAIHSYESGRCGYIKFFEEEREWFIRPNGTGLDSKPLVIPASCVLTQDDEVVYDIIV